MGVMSLVFLLSELVCFAFNLFYSLKAMDDTFVSHQNVTVTYYQASAVQ